LFGPHPELDCQSIIQWMEKTMKVDITDKDCNNSRSKHCFNGCATTNQLPKTQSNKVFQWHMNQYLEILDCLNKQACTLQEDEIDIILNEKKI
jgi:hypothetical protein